jgi:hypothetical protein
MFTINVPLPGFDAATVAKVKKLLDGYQKAADAGPVRGGVVVEGDAAAYALVWEWGNARQTKEGPKTVKGMNPDGEEVWLSIQAPFGFIAINEPTYFQIIEQHLSAIDFSEVETAKDILDAMKKASSAAATEIAEVIRQHAPYDSGQLREEIQPADPDDPDLAVTDNDIELGEGLNHIIRATMKKLKG